MPDKDIPDIQVDCVGITVCPRCAATVDVSGLRAFETARCESCKTEFPAPGKIGPYVLLRQLSLSETGATYRGFDTSMSRHVQVNVMRRALRQDKGKVSAFLAEARALAALDNRNAARAFFVGDEDGRPYSVTEWIEGPSLESVLSAGKAVKENRALEMGIDLVRVLAAAARMGLVHGDIRPANIFITPKSKAKLVNFRFAGAGARPATADAPPISETYASPEHLAGREIDSRSDVFALGATLFHALTGQPPFDGNASQGRLDAPPPDALAARPVLRQATADVLAGMLQADPDKRHGGDFPDLLARLRRALKASKKPKSDSEKPPEPVVAKLATSIAPPSVPGVDAATALAEMMGTRRLRRRPKASQDSRVLPLELLPEEPPPVEPPPDETPPSVPMPVQIPTRHTDDNAASVMALLVDDEPAREQPLKDWRSRKNLVTVLAAAGIVAVVAAGVLIAVLAGAFETKAETETAKASPFRGKIGLGTWQTAAEFKDVRVFRDTLTVFETNFKKDGVAQWKPIRGKWKHRGEVYRQKDGGAKDAFTVVGDASWSDYTLTLKARKTGGRDGFFIPFRWLDEKNYFVWNVGGSSNKHHAVQRVKNGGQARNVSKQVNGSVETNKWYDIKIELTGPRIRCYLDGKLINDVEVK